MAVPMPAAENTESGDLEADPELRQPRSGAATVRGAVGDSLSSAGLRMMTMQS